MNAWHFVRADGCLGYDDGRKVVVGETLRVEPPIQLCERGLHASKRAMEALQYAPGPIACYVSLSGEIIEGDDKCVATERTVIAMADATDTLWAMSRWAALQVIHLWDAPAVVRQFLETGDESLRAAARAAARDAVWAAARDAVWAAAWAAVWAAAWAAVWAAAWAAAWDAQNTELERLLRELLKVPA